MANIDDLNYISISEMQTDEALEVLRQIRLSRRVPLKTKKKPAAKKPKANVSAEQAAEILRILEGSK